MKKGQGLSISAIVVAAIALIVLVVLVLIFTGNIGNFGTGVKQDTDTCVSMSSSEFQYVCRQSCVGDGWSPAPSGTYKDCDITNTECCQKKLTQE